MRWFLIGDGQATFAQLGGGARRYRKSGRWRSAAVERLGSRKGGGITPLPYAVPEKKACG